MISKFFKPKYKHLIYLEWDNRWRSSIDEWRIIISPFVSLNVGEEYFVTLTDAIELKTRTVGNQNICVKIKSMKAIHSEKVYIVDIVSFNTEPMEAETQR